MKTLLTLLLGLATLTPALLAGNYAASEKFAHTYPISDHGELSLENVNGSVEIVAWDKPEISLEAEKRANNTDDLQLITLKIEASPDRLSIKTEHQKSGWFNFSIKGEVRYVLKVPAGLILRHIEAVNAQITIRGVRGLVTAETVNGSLHVEGLAANTHLETVNGGINASFDSVASDQTISIETVNGSCTLRLPSATDAYLKAETVNGGIKCDLPIKTDKTGRNKLHGQLGQSNDAKINIETVNGGITVQLSE